VTPLLKTPWPGVFCLLAVLCLIAPLPVQAGAIDGGEINAPGERSHNVYLGWPEASYVWEGLVQERRAIGPRVGVQLWPLALSFGLNTRTTLLERGRVSLALGVIPAFSIAGFGGTKAVYPQNYQWGRSRSFRPSLGPGVTISLLASVDLSPRFRLLLSFENPLSFWVWVQPTQWWLEWPMIISGGIEYELNYNTSLIAILGGGPSIAFSGPSQLLGLTGRFRIGVQHRY
tara:strand:+ start:3914 stop:4603 length:690 start_codon:yes stop_codon:yes gene_type:complete